MGPLADVRILEFDAIGPVPLAAMLLSDMGADIVRIARAGGQSAYEDVGGAILNRGRQAVELDLKSAAGRQDALALVGRADILIEGFRPGVMERLGLGPEECLAQRGQLVYARMTGWGQAGPLALRAGHDINYIAITGALAAIGRSDAPPVPPLNIVGDYAAGAMMLLTGVLAALTEARSSGQGQVVDVAMSDGVPLMMSLFSALQQRGSWSEMRESNLLDGGAPFYRTYECADGKYVAVGALEPQFFKLLLKGLDLDPAAYLQNERSSWPAMAQDFDQRFRTRTRDEWAAVFEATDACVSPVLTMSEASAHPHAVARDGYALLDGTRHPAPAPRFSRTPGRIRPAAIATTTEVLERWGRSP